MAGQISQYEHVSEDFSGFLLVMSRRFADDLLSNMQERLFLRDNPCFPLNGTELDLYMFLETCIDPDLLEILLN